MSLNLGVMSAAVTLDDADYRRKLSGLEGVSESTFRKIAGLAAGYLTGRMLFNFGRSAVQAFTIQQDAIEGVRATLRNLGREVEMTTFRYDSFAKLMQQKTKFGDEVVLGSMSQGMRLGITPDQIEEVTRAAIGLTAKLGIDLPTAMTFLGRASQGHTETLVRYGITLDSSKSKEEQFQELLKKSIEAFPLAEEAAKTAGGQLAQFRNTVGDTAEVLGRQLWGTIGGTVGQFDDLLKKFNDADPALQRLAVRGVALAAALALIGKSGAIGIGNRAISGAASMISGAMSGGGLGGVRAKAEADAVAASEALKRAEYEKTEAMRESRAAQTQRRFAIYQRREAEAAANAARYDLSVAQKGGDQTQILAAKKKLASAENALVKAQVAEAQATQTLQQKHQLAMTATAQHTAATRANTIAQNTNAKTATFAGRAQIVLSNGMRAAGTAAKGLYAALGPVGIAMLAVSAAYMAFDHIQEKNRRELEYATEAATRRADAAKAEAAATAEAISAEVSGMSRLQEMARYERLNNSEKKEAQRLVEDLTKKYGDLGISFDTATGKIRIATGAMAKLNAEQAKLRGKKIAESVNANQSKLDAEMSNLFNEFDTYKAKFLRTWGEGLVAPVMRAFGISTKSSEELERSGATVSAEQLEIKKISELRTAEEKLVALERLRNKLTNDSRSEEAKKVQAVIDTLKEQVKLEEQLADENAARKKGETGRAGKTAELRKQSEAERKEQTALENKEWQIRFDSSSVDQQIAMLDEKIAKTFQLQSGKYKTLDDFKSADRSKMTEQELKDLQTIVELEQKRRQTEEKAFNERVARLRSEGKLSEAIAELEKRRNGIYAQAAKATPEQLAEWGRRFNPATGKMDGDQKQAGWRGILPDGKGNVMTEVSVGTEIDGKQVEIPLIVPDSTEEELSRIAKVANGELTEIPPDIMEKAVAFAKKRMAEGKSAFYNGDEADESVRRIYIKNAAEYERLQKEIAASKREGAKAFQAENDTYQRYLRERDRQQQGRAVERELQQAERSGDRDAADAIMKREYEKAQAAAANLKQEYERAVKEAQKDGIMTEEERKRIDERRRAMERALSDEDRWGDRIKDSEARQADVRKHVGSFSTEVLNAMLGGNNSPEKETAKNTKEMVRLQRQTLEKASSSGTYK